MAFRHIEIGHIRLQNIRDISLVLMKILTSVKNDRARESCTIFRQVSSLRSSVAIFPSMNKDDFARVRATFIRRVSDE
jgi:hypothetical protein